MRIVCRVVTLPWQVALGLSGAVRSVLSANINLNAGVHRFSKQ